MSLQKLQTIAAAGQAAVYMTAQEGGELASQGLIQVNTGEQDPNNPLAYRVQLTDAGRQQLEQNQGQNQGQTAYGQQVPGYSPVPSYPQADQNVQNAPQQGFNVPTAQQPNQGQQGPQNASQAAQKPSFKIASDVPVPKVKRGGGSNFGARPSQYPFDQLEENQSFHVPATEDEPEPWKKMASNVSAANSRNEVEVEPREMVTVKRRKLRKDENDKPVIGPDGKKVYDESTEEVAKTKPTKRFIARRVDSNDPEGAGVRVYRVPLDFRG